ncbi:MAG: TolB family protein, partial [Rhodanobacteraceae bacterium]
MPFARHGLMLLVVSAALVIAPGLQAKAPPTASSENAKIEQILAQRAKVRDIPAVALSYDGQHLAWLVSYGDDTKLMLGSWNGQGTHAVAIPGGCREDGIRWAPRANRLAVLTRCKVDPSNTRPIRGAIWLIDVNAATTPKKVADLDGFADGMQWSRDGKRIAFLYVPGATRLPEATASGNPRVGVIGESDVQVQHVATVAVTGGAPEVLTPEGLYVYEFSVSSTGDRIAYTAAKPPGDNNWWTAKLYVQDAKARAAPKTIVDPKQVSGPLHGLQIALPHWSPDDARILFIGGLMSDRGATGGDIYGVPASGGKPVDLTMGTKVSPSWFTSTDGHSLLVNQIADGTVQVAKYVLADNVAR